MGKMAIDDLGLLLVTECPHYLTFTV